MGLNEAQKDAVLHKDGPCLVLAGPGSGKTLTIVNRVKYLIEGYKVRPEEILVVTFTRFAAAEMRSRLCSLMGKEDSGDDRDISWDLLWNPSMDLPDRTEESALG